MNPHHIPKIHDSDINEQEIPWEKKNIVLSQNKCFKLCTTVITFKIDSVCDSLLLVINKCVHMHTSMLVKMGFLEYPGHILCM